MMPHDEHGYDDMDQNLKFDDDSGGDGQKDEGEEDDVDVLMLMIVIGPVIMHQQGILTENWFPLNCGAHNPASPNRSTNRTPKHRDLRYPPLCCQGACGAFHAVNRG